MFRKYLRTKTGRKNPHLTFNFKMETGTISQSVWFEASPEAVYELLTDKVKYESFVGDEVFFEPIINGSFSVFGGYCTGINLKLEPGKEIVQKWNFQEDGWPETHFSECSFLFQAENGGCSLQSGIPIHKVEALKSGWEKYYWTPMKEWLAKSSSNI
jgi:activator of HSP90 ATPase